MTGCSAGWIVRPDHLAEAEPPVRKEEADPSRIDQAAVAGEPIRRGNRGRQRIAAFSQLVHGFLSLQPKKSLDRIMQQEVACHEMVTDFRQQREK
jgi:hypothetical protein